METLTLRFFSEGFFTSGLLFGGLSAPLRFISGSQLRLQDTENKTIRQLDDSLYTGAEL